jgi:hypothetical protein
MTQITTVTPSFSKIRRRIAATGLAALVIAGTTLAGGSPASAGWNSRYGWGVGAGVAAGVVGGLALGALAAESARPVYVEEPVYGDCYIVKRKVWTSAGWRWVRRTACD